MNVALITGAASGIGLALTHIYLKKGVKVIMVDKDSSKLFVLSQKLQSNYPKQITTVTCDITKKDDVAQLIELTKLDRIDWIYNNAGTIGTLAPIWELKSEHINHVMDVNVNGMLNLIRAFIPYLIKQEHPSHIINIASLYALCSSTHTAAYSMSKHAVLSLSETLYFDLKKIEKPIHVSVAFPSFTDTSLIANLETDDPLHASLNKLLSHSRPASDVAEHIVQEVESGKFYVFPDKEVKGYYEDRTKAILMQENPNINNIEKLMSALIKRVNQ